MAENRINGSIFLIYTKKPQPYAGHKIGGVEMKVYEMSMENYMWK